MLKIEVRLDDQLEERIRSLANQNAMDVRDFVQLSIEQLAGKPDNDTHAEPLLGLFSDIPQIMDEIVRDSYQFRRHAPMRVPLQ